MNWWPHDNFHRANGFNLPGLIRIEYGFHVTLYLAGIVVAWFFISVLRGLGEPVSQKRQEAAGVGAVQGAMVDR